MPQGIGMVKRVTHTKVEFESSVHPKQTSGLHDIPDGFESAGRPDDL